MRSANSVLLIEADGKALLRDAGIAIPDGVVVSDAAAALPVAGPWMVKAQVPVGGRGKAGGVVRCATTDDVRRRCIGCLAFQSRATPSTPAWSRPRSPVRTNTTCR